MRSLIIIVIISSNVAVAGDCLLFKRFKNLRESFLKLFEIKGSFVFVSDHALRGIEAAFAGLAENLADQIR
jgi:hypothetical protein